MAGERALPGLALNAFWTLGSNGYKTQMDENFRMLSALVQPRVKSSVASVPGSPANGDIHRITAGGDINKIAVRDNGAWVYYVPQEGWMFYDQAADARLLFDGTNWITITPAITTLLGLTDTPSSYTGQKFKSLRVNSASNALVFVEDVSNLYTITANANFTDDHFAGDGLIEVDSLTDVTLTIPAGLTRRSPVSLVQLNTGRITIAAAGGVTILSADNLVKSRVQNSGLVLHPRSATSYFLFGDLSA